MTEIAKYLHGKFIAKECVRTGVNTVEVDMFGYGTIDRESLNSELQKRGLFLYSAQSWLRLFHRFTLIIGSE